MFSHPKILFLVSLLFVALLNPKFNPYLLFKFLLVVFNDAASKPCEQRLNTKEHSNAYKNLILRFYTVLQYYSGKTSNRNLNPKFLL